MRSPKGKQTEQAVSNEELAAVLARIRYIDHQTAIGQLTGEERVELLNIFVPGIGTLENGDGMGSKKRSELFNVYGQWKEIREPQRHSTHYPRDFVPPRFYDRIMDLPNIPVGHRPPAA